MLAEIMHKGVYMCNPNLEIYSAWAHFYCKHIISITSHSLSSPFQAWIQLEPVI